MGNGQFADYVMTIFPEDQYNRVIHFTDPVPDQPSMLLGFKHAGHEIWYFSPMGSDFSYKECKNQAFKQENRGCSHTLFMRPFAEDHRKYLNEKISWLCDRYEPSNKMLKIEKEGSELDQEDRESW